MSTKLRIADNLSLPLEAITQTLCILGIRGSGKTHTATVMVEEMLKAGQPVCIYDPVGAWFGLKASADGRRPGFPVVVFGGEHADVPLTKEAGETVARVIVERRIPAILDVSLMRKGERTQFMTAFCETLYHQNREPLHFVIDEAHTIAPQKPMPEAARLLGAVEDIILQGRRRGLGLTVVSQRPALLNTNVRTQCATLIAMRIIGPHDLKAIREWTDAHGTTAEADELMETLPTMKTGEGWIWSPAWLKLFQRARFRQRETFDSGATPEVGKRAVTPKVLAEIDLAALGKEIQATVENAKANDPAALKAELVRLRAEVAKRPAQAPAAAPVKVPVPVVTDAQVQQVEGIVARMEREGQDRIRAAAELKQTGEELMRVGREFAAALGKASAARVMPERPAARPLPVATPRIPREPRASDASGEPLSKAERRALSALAQYPSGRTKRQVALLAGYAVSGGGFNNALSSLRSKGFVTTGDPLSITDAGTEALGDFDALPAGKELLDHWRAQLGKAEREILDVLAEAFPQSLAKEELASRTPSQYAASGGGFNNAMSRLRTLELIEGRSEIRASAELFDGALA